MTSGSKASRRLLAALGTSAVVRAWCWPAAQPAATPATTSQGPTTPAAAIIVGTTDKVTTLDPAGSYDNGSFFVMNQVYPVPA